MGVPVRECGECTACCTVLNIPRLAKGPGVSCHNLTPTGCGIYEDRPDQPCKSFNCAWLQGFLGDDDRPDKAGAIIWQSLLSYRLETIVSQLPDMEVAPHLLDFLNTLPMPIRLERIGEEPVYLKDGGT